jgi:hypothetical protein
MTKRLEKSVALSKTEPRKPEKMVIKEVINPHIAKSIHNYIGIIKAALVLGIPRRTAEMVF